MSLLIYHTHCNTHYLTHRRTYCKTQRHRHCNTHYNTPCFRYIISRCVLLRICRCLTFALFKIVVEISFYKESLTTGMNKTCVRVSLHEIYARGSTRKHPNKPPANNPATLAVVKKRYSGAKGRICHRAVKPKGSRKARLRHLASHSPVAKTLRAAILTFVHG